MIKSELRIINITKYRLRILAILIVSILYNNEALFSQDMVSNYSLFGNCGLIETPTARIGNDKKVGLGLSYLPENYRVLRNNPGYSPELHFNIDIVFLPFMEVTGSLIHPLNNKNHYGGIGDRGVKVKLRILKEKEYLPAIAIGIHDPAGANTNNGAFYFVGSKRYKISENISIDTHFGFGFDITKSMWELTGIFMDDGSKNISRLNGVFCGSSITYRRIIFLAEYDTNHINFGIVISPFDYTHFKILVIDGASFAFGASFDLYSGI